MRHSEYLLHDATALAALVRGGAVQALQLLELALAQLQRVQPKVNAVVRLMEDEARRQISQPLPGVLGGVLAGVPWLLKDGLQDYAGVPTTSGSRSLQGFVPAVHAATTRRFLQAGLVIFGKTNLPEFGLKGITDPQLFGHASNPWNLAHTPGGSSGGAAAAVASGVLPMAAGSDGGGSIRIPAACCGLFGLKPSRGRISEGPAVGEVWFGACTHGVLSRSVRDSALALDILCGPEPGDPFLMAVPSEPFVLQAARAPRRLRIGWSTASPVGTPVHHEAVAAVEQAVTLLKSLGHDVEPATPAINGDALAQAFQNLYFGQVPAAVAYAIAQGARRSDFEFFTQVLAVLGQATGAGVLTGHLAQWNVFARSLGDFFKTYDLMLTPTLARPPVRHGELDPPAWQEQVLGALMKVGLLGPLVRSGVLKATIDQIALDNLAPFPYTQLANLTGVPAMSVPLHWTADGLPLGVQFVAPMGDEATLLQLATQLEQAQPWFNRLPALATA